MELTNIEEKYISDFVNQFSISSTSSILEFGKIIEDRLKLINNLVFEQVRNKDNSEINNLVSCITEELMKINPQKKRIPWYKKIFSNEVEDNSRPNYDIIIFSIAQLLKELKKHIVILQKDLHLMNLLSENSSEYIHELDMYLLCGELILKNANEKALVAKKNNDENLYNDLLNGINNFEKRLYDLRLLRQITIQSIPQINMIKDNNYVLIDKINYLINNTIPLWRGQIIILMSNENANKNVEITSEVSKMMNQMLIDNSSGLTEMTQSVKEELSKGMVTSKTLAETTKMVINSLNELNNKEEEKSEVLSLK